MALPQKDVRDIGPQGRIQQRTIGLPKWVWGLIDQKAKAASYKPGQVVRHVMTWWVTQGEKRSRK